MFIILAKVKGNNNTSFSLGQHEIYLLLYPFLFSTIIPGDIVSFSCVYFIINFYFKQSSSSFLFISPANFVGS